MNKILDSDTIIIDSKNYCDVLSYDDSIYYHASYISKLLGNIFETVNILGDKKLMGSSDNLSSTYIPKTELGKKLINFRSLIESEGNANLSADDIEKELIERRGGITYEEF